MHMADALLSPAVGGLMWAAAAGALALAARRLRDRADEAWVPLMGMLGAFVFTAQMINFSIPGTGSSGHLGGALLLAILLGPQAALVVIASVLAVQALFFADGGLLAFGANLFNLGVLSCWVAYPLVYRPLAGQSPGPLRRSLAAVAAAVAGLQLAALGVVLQTTASGISALPLQTFLLLMLPVHGAIGLVEGLATAALLGFLQRSRPELLAGTGLARPPAAPRARRAALATLAAAALLTGGVLSWLASARPDGLEWSVEQAAGTTELPVPAASLQARLAQWQQALAWLPGYDRPAATPGALQPPAVGAAAPTSWPEVKLATSLAGVVGGVATLLLVMVVGRALRRRRAAA